MPPELPGFYYDAEKNRYFPIKGPIPGSSAKPTSLNQPPNKTQDNGTVSKQPVNSHQNHWAKASNLLQARELVGNKIYSERHKCSFMEEFRKFHASQPVIWKYQDTRKFGDSALERISVGVQMAEGQIEGDVLIGGSTSGPCSVSLVGKLGQEPDYMVSKPSCVSDYTKKKEDRPSMKPDDLVMFAPLGVSLSVPPYVSCIKLSGTYCYAVDSDCRPQNALITTLGSEVSGGHLYALNLIEPFDFHPRTFNLRQKLHKIASISCTIWCAESGSNQNLAVIGTNLGSASVDLETGVPLWLLHSKSDVFAQQIMKSGNVVLCGLRNGAIVTVDLRDRRGGSSRIITHRIPYLSSNKPSGKHRKWMKLSGNIRPSHTIRMPSSISSLVSLQFDDQYFLASSMDGSVKLYDHRLTQRGSVQCYEGNVNSHTRIQLGVDPSERFVMSGGEDCNLRLWSIKSGEMLFENKFSNSVASTVCWQSSDLFLLNDVVLSRVVVVTSIF